MDQHRAAFVPLHPKLEGGDDRLERLSQTRVN